MTPRSALPLAAAVLIPTLAQAECPLFTEDVSGLGSPLTTFDGCPTTDTFPVGPAGTYGEPDTVVRFLAPVSGDYVVAFSAYTLNPWYESQEVASAVLTSLCAFEDAGSGFSYGHQLRLDAGQSVSFVVEALPGEGCEFIDMYVLACEHESDDPDGDGLSSCTEIVKGEGADPFDADSDGGGVPDGLEVREYVSNPWRDTDDCTSPDSDGDGICDANDYCTGDDRTGDPDGDGVCSDIDASCDISTVSLGSAVGDDLAPITCVGDHQFGTLPPEGSVCLFERDSSAWTEEVFEWTAPADGLFQFSTGGGWGGNLASLNVRRADDCGQTQLGCTLWDADGTVTVAALAGETFYASAYVSICGPGSISVHACTADSDGDGVCDAFDSCPGHDDRDDNDGDLIPLGCDGCRGDNITGDTDGDGVCDDLDLCPLDALDDRDGDGVCDSDDDCPNRREGWFDADLDGMCEPPPPCDGTVPDSDGDGYCDAIDLCAGDDRSGDSDGDGLCDDGDFVLLATPMRVGETMRFATFGAPPGSIVDIYLSIRGFGAAPCGSGGACGDLDRPLRLARLQANATGDAYHEFTVPAAAGRKDFALFQAMWDDGAANDLSQVVVRIPRGS